VSKKATNLELDPVSYSGNGDDRSGARVDILGALISRLRALVLSTTVGLLLGVLAALIIPNRYTAETRILPPEKNQSIGSALMGQLGMLTGLSTKGLGVKDSNEAYESMLKSRTIADTLIERFQLRDVYQVRTFADARKVLESATDITTSKDNVIYLRVTDRDPKRAADIANAYAEELYSMNKRLAVGEAAQRRQFFEAELRNEKDALSGAEVDLRRTQETTGLIQLDAQAKAIIEAIANLRAQIAAKEVQLRAMRSYAAESNAELIRAQSQLAGLRQQLAGIQKGQDTTPGDVIVPASKVPTAGLEYVRKLREVKYHEALFEILAKQLEIARIDESKEIAALQIIDVAAVPEKKSSPKYSLYGLGGLLAGLFLGVAIVLLRARWNSWIADPLAATRIDSWRDSLRSQFSRSRPL
jgi:tyrosine-protein kinase Etk/Wzc